jgi:hypothetical protein
MPAWLAHLHQNKVYFFQERGTCLSELPINARLLVSAVESPRNCSREIRYAIFMLELALKIVRHRGCNNFDLAERSCVLLACSVFSWFTPLSVRSVFSFSDQGMLTLASFGWVSGWSLTGHYSSREKAWRRESTDI